MGGLAWQAIFAGPQPDFAVTPMSKKARASLAAANAEAAVKVET